jgi:hypothetical protein
MQNTVRSFFAVLNLMVAFSVIELGDQDRGYKAIDISEMK